MANYVTAIELSSSGIKLVVGYVYQDKVYVMHASEGEPLSVDKEDLINQSEAEKSLSSLLAEARRVIGNDLGSSIALLPPDGFRMKEDTESTMTVSSDSKIVQLDYANCISMIKKAVKEEGSEVIYCDPLHFETDSNESMSFPLGETSDKIYVTADAHLLPKSRYNRYIQILRDLDIFPYLTLLSPLGGLTFIKSTNPPKEYISLDIERDYSYITHIRNNHMVDSGRIPFGIDNGNKNVSIMLSTTLDRASELRHLFGFVAKKECISNPVPEVADAEELYNTFRESFSPIIEGIETFIKGKAISEGAPIVLYGLAKDEEGLDAYLKSSLNRAIYTIKNTIIGARKQSYINCLGGIICSYYPFQTPASDVKRDIKTNSFGRN